ncbi:Neuronal acetylcholine receptor subunit alpha-6, partial [Eufriesea mexicana]
MKNLFPVLFVIFDVLLIKQATSSSIFCKDIPRNTSMLQLYNYLFCNYNSYERSIDKNKNTTAIDFGLNVYHFQVIWKDSHFVWKPQDFGNIRSIRVTSNMIWTPDIVIHSATPWNVDMEIPTTQCIIQYDGTVIYVAPIIYLTFCDFDHTWWPYDMMNCSIHIASWSHSNKEVTLRSKNFKLEPELLLDAPYKNLEWETVEISQSKHEVDFKFGLGFTTDLLAYNILIKRKSSMYSIIYMTFAIVVFYEKSLVLAAFSLILTSTLRYLEELNNEAPMWVSSTIVSILESRVGQVFLVSILDPKVSARIEMNVDDNTNLMSLDKKEFTWRYTSILIGWLAFLSVLFVYIIILIVSLPTSWYKS